jgi:hypothetical protein
MSYGFMFSVHEYDKDGDVSEKGIFLHFGDTRIKIAETMQELADFIKRLESMTSEIKENYEADLRGLP